MFSFKFALSHFLHRLKAKNRHGLHSPFVYRVVDEVIYDFSEKKEYRQIEKSTVPAKKLNSVDKLLYRLAADAKPNTLWILGKYKPADLLILQQTVPLVKVKSLDNSADWKDADLPDVIFIDVQLNPQSAIDLFNRVLPQAGADTLLIAHNIHQNVLTKASWEVMRSHSKVTASVNLFWMGLLYFRPGQVKEDFLIKI